MPQAIKGLAVKSPPSDQDKREKKKILIVDDEMDMRIFMSTLFETSGYTSIASKEGATGLQKARALRPNLIILDIMMPGEGGALMYRQLKIDKLLKSIPVIMLSAVGEKTFRHYLKMLNAQSQSHIHIPEPDAYIEKPPDPDEVLRTARALMGD